MMRSVLAQIVLSMVSSTAVLACGFHNYAPQPAFVDRMLASDQVVLARPDRANPFRYTATERLLGDGALSDIPYLVDSTSRRKLASDRDAAVLFARSAVDGTWHRTAFVDSATEPVVRTVIEKLPQWSQKTDTARFQFFASLADHPDATIHQMALRELDLAPYGVLRDLPIIVDETRLSQPLDDPTQQQLKPIRILLLGLSGAQDIAAGFIAGLDRQVRVEGSTLGAYATALIELEGADAIDAYIVPHLKDPQASLLVREVLIQAMSMHAGSDDADLEKSIVSSVRQALALEPALMGAVVRNFGWRAGQ